MSSFFCQLICALIARTLSEIRLNIITVKNLPRAPALEIITATEKRKMRTNIIAQQNFLATYWQVK